MGSDAQSAVYMGRGKQPDMYLDNITAAMEMTNVTANDSAYLRDEGLSALDAAAFQYTIYGALTRFLG